MTQVVKHILIFSNFVNYCEADSILLIHPLQHYTVTFTVSKMKEERESGKNGTRQKICVESWKKKKFVATAKLYFLIKLIVGEHKQSTLKPFSFLIMHHHWPEPRKREEKKLLENFLFFILMRCEECGWKNYELDIKIMIFIKSWTFSPLYSAYY